MRNARSHRRGSFGCGSKSKSKSKSGFGFGLGSKLGSAEHCSRARQAAFNTPTECGMIRLALASWILSSQTEPRTVAASIWSPSSRAELTDAAMIEWTRPARSRLFRAAVSVAGGASGRDKISLGQSRWPSATLLMRSRPFERRQCFRRRQYSAWPPGRPLSHCYVSILWPEDGAKRIRPEDGEPTF